MSTISAIVCVSPTGGIGDKDGNLLYRNREDLSFFSGFTQGKECLVGYNTLATLPALANRSVRLSPRKIILDLNLLSEHVNKDVVVIGGEKTYRIYAPQIEELFVTKMINLHDKEEHSKFPFSSYYHLKNSETILISKGFTIVRYFK